MNNPTLCRACGEPHGLLSDDADSDREMERLCKEYRNLLEGVMQAWEDKRLEATEYSGDADIIFDNIKAALK